MDLLKSYPPASDDEYEYKSKMLQLFEEKGDAAFQRTNLEAHFTASAWIINLRSKKVLLLHHRKLNKWLQPGGHADGEKNLETVARKEAQEETGLQNLNLLINRIFDIDIHLIPARKEVPAHYHYDVRFAYLCDDMNDTMINNESNSFKWIDLDRVENLTEEPSIIRMVRKSKTQIDGL